jgi:hypothetical protein
VYSGEGVGLGLFQMSTESEDLNPSDFLMKFCMVSAGVGTTIEIKRICAS